jgi:hypothetical protein
LLGKKSIPYLIITMLVIALGFTSSAAFAYWQDVSQIGNVVIRFEGEDASLVVEAQHDEFTGRLVPEGRVYVVGEVDQVVFEYDVSVDKTLVQSMNLIVEAKDVLIGESDEYSHLVDISIGNAKDYFVNELFNTVVTITIIVRLLEPIDHDEAVEKGLDLELVNVDDSQLAYNTIKGENISFTISFRVEPKIVE